MLKLVSEFSDEIHKAAGLCEESLRRISVGEKSVRSVESRFLFLFLLLYRSSEAELSSLILNIVTYLFEAPASSIGQLGYPKSGSVFGVFTSYFSSIRYAVSHSVKTSILFPCLLQ